MQETRQWNTLKVDRQNRMRMAIPLVKMGKIVDKSDIVKLLETVIKPYDRVCVEGNNQKQADFLSKALCKVDNSKVNNLHMIQSAISLPEHLDVFDKGIARKVDFSFSGPQASRLATMVEEKKIEIGAIHTYLELFGRLFIDLTPRVLLSAAYEADREGNIYTGFNTEDTPTLVEATKYKQGIVIVQVNKIVDKLPRVDIPADCVDFVIEAPEEFYIEPLFTRDPSLITNQQILKAMMTIKGIYAEYGIKRLNHGVGFDTAAIELLLPTYGEKLGLKGKICTHFALNPHPTLIPAIESGWVESIHSFGGELGMEEYIKQRSDIFFVGPDDSLRSNRALSQVAGHYAIDLFVGGTLQIDKFGNSSTATGNRIAGFGGAPNMGCDSRGRRHVTDSWIKCGGEDGMQSSLLGDMPRGRKLVVQLQDTFREKMAPGFVEKLDAWKLSEKAGFSIPPVMIYGDDVSHIVTEEGVAYLNRCGSLEERMDAIKAVAGYTELGLDAKAERTKELRYKGIVKTPEDFDIDVATISRDMLAAKNVKDLVNWSGGLYNPPAKFRNW